tara:strand:- start:1050 stop:1202 length:153 start_codon:yes stop_codon:yes gene_type:complete
MSSQEATISLDDLQAIFEDFEEACFLQTDQVVWGVKYALGAVSALITDLE